MIMGDGETGFSRRDLIKRSAVAGAVVWAYPLLESSSAWGTAVNCNECNGLTLYSKYAPGNSNTVGNQCLAPCPPVTVVSSEVLANCGLIQTTDSKDASGREFSQISFTNTSVHLIRTSIKSTNDCYTTTCADNFCNVGHYTPATNPPCDSEPTSPSQSGPLDPAMFTFFAPDFTTVCGVAPSGSVAADGTTGHTCGCTTDVRAVKYSTAALSQPLNFLEILLCLRGTSTLPC